MGRIRTRQGILMMYKYMVDYFRYTKRLSNTKFASVGHVFGKYVHKFIHLCIHVKIVVHINICKLFYWNIKNVNILVKGRIYRIRYWTYMRSNFLWKIDFF